jgi:hypothetical protein
MGGDLKLRILEGYRTLSSHTFATNNNTIKSIIIDCKVVPWFPYRMRCQKGCNSDGVKLFVCNQHHCWLILSAISDSISTGNFYNFKWRGKTERNQYNDSVGGSSCLFQVSISVMVQWRVILCYSTIIGWSVDTLHIIKICHIFM